MKTLTGTLLSIPRYIMLGLYMFFMVIIFLITAIGWLPFWLASQIKHQILS